MMAAPAPAPPAVGDELDMSTSADGHLEDVPTLTTTHGVAKKAAELYDEIVEPGLVRIFDPQQHGEGRSRYTSYCILLRSADAPSRRRRYGDFQWLSRVLREERPGAIVPLLPHRSAVLSDKRFSFELLQFRCKTCEAWVNRVMSSPELDGAPSLVAFLRADDDTFAAAKRTGGVEVCDQGDELEVYKSGAGESGSSGSGNGGIGNRFPRLKKIASMMATKLAMASGADLERSDDELAFEEIEDYITDLDAHVQALAKQASALVRTYKEQNHIMEGLGTKFSAAGSLSFPNTTSTNCTRLSTLLNNIGDGVWNQSLTEIKRHDELAVKFFEPVEDLRRDVQSVRLALQVRREVQVDYTARVNRVQSKTNTLKLIREEPHENIESQRLREKYAVEELEEAKKDEEAAHGKFAEVCARVLRDVERFRTQMRDKIRVMILMWAITQREYNSMARSGWGDLRSSALLGR